MPKRAPAIKLRLLVSTHKINLDFRIQSKHTCLNFQTNNLVHK